MKEETDLTRTSARKLARLLFDIERTKRQKIIWCLDSDFRSKVLEEINTLEGDLPVGLRDTLPPGKVPNCS